MTKISQLSDIGASLAGGDEFVIRDVSDATTPNKKVTSSGIIDYVIGTGSVTGFTKISAGAGSLSEVACTFSGSTSTITMGTASAGSPFERLRIDSAGRLLVGTSSARSNFFNTVFVPSQFLIETTGQGVEAAFIRNETDDNGAALILAKSKGSASGSNTLVASGDYLGEIYFMGNDGSEFVLGAGISCMVDGTPGADDMPGRLVFSTTADGTALPTERMRIDSSGKLLVGTSTTARGATFQVNGVIAYADANNTNYTQPTIAIANGATTTFNVVLPTGNTAFQLTLSASANGGDRVGGVVAILYGYNDGVTRRHNLQTLNNTDWSFSGTSISGATVTITVTNSSGFAGHTGSVSIIRLA